MQYREDRKGNKISVLGYGCMRFSRQGISVDLDKAEAEVMAAIKGGVNYLDTAYIYPGNEAAVGEILHRTQCRDKVYLATKLPHYMIKSMEGIEKIFCEQLRRLQTDHIDYYLMHMLTDTATWEKLKQLESPIGYRKNLPQDKSAILVFLIMEIQKCSNSWWMPMTGTSARFNIIIWMKPPRQESKD